MDSYKEFTDKLKRLRTEMRLTRNEFAEKVMKDLDEEFSKYLQAEDFQEITGFPTPHHEITYLPRIDSIKPDDNHRTKIYMVDDTYGIDFYASCRSGDNEIVVYIYTWHTINNVKGRKFISNNNAAIYYPNQEPDYKKFVKKYIERMKKNIIERDLRKLKRDAKKYNL